MGLRPLRTRLVAAAAVAAFGATVGLAAAAAAVTMKSSLNGSLAVKIVVSSTGRTLYHDAAEAKNTVKCTGACSTEWLPYVVTAGAKPVAGPGVTASKLGVLKRPDGKMQVTYAGFPLYLYAGDSKAGEVNGQGVGGIWHAIAPTGIVVTKAAKSAATSGGSSSSTSSGSTSKSGGSTGSTGGSSSGGTSGSTGGTSTGGGATTPNDCITNPGGYGCM
jgi:predicted lipoprotein with Yx(FWY)xxD motif